MLNRRAGWGAGLLPSSVAEAKQLRDSGWLGQLPRDLSLSGNCTSGSLWNHGKNKRLLLFGFLRVRRGEKETTTTERKEKRTRNKTTGNELPCLGNRSCSVTVRAVCLPCPALLQRQQNETPTALGLPGLGSTSPGGSTHMALHIPAAKLGHHICPPGRARCSGTSPAADAAGGEEKNSNFHPSRG